MLLVAVALSFVVDKRCFTMGLPPQASRIETIIVTLAGTLIVPLKGSLNV